MMVGSAAATFPINRVSSKVLPVCNASHVLWFETVYDANAWLDWLNVNWQVSFWLAGAYVVAIFALKRFMRDRRPLELRLPLFLWSTVLAVFSIAGAVRSLLPLYYVVSEYGFEESMCHSPFICPRIAFWVSSFCISKVLEFVDTAFIILRKRPLLFLHWYHHATVMVYTWYSSHNLTGAGRWFTSMNFGVHAVMYTYYALRASRRVKLPRWLAMGITSLQIAQMVMGILINIINLRVKLRGDYCHQTYANLTSCFLMYFSYFVLFAMYFHNTYFGAARRQRGTTTTKSIASQPPLPSPPATHANGNGSSVSPVSNGRVIKTTAAATADMNGVSYPYDNHKKHR